MISLLNAISHFLVDGVCVSMLYTAYGKGIGIATAVIVYNSCAFSTQCIFGFLFDSYSRKRFSPAENIRFHGRLEALSMLLVALAFWLPAGIIFKTVLIGIGNSIFHVAGGVVTLKKSEGKASPLGIFVAPGAFGVTLGTFFPQSGVILSMLLCLSATLCTVLYAKQFDADRAGDIAASAAVRDAGSEDDGNTAAVLLLTAAVAVRAIGGSAVSFSWKNGAMDAMILTLAVFLGKSLGGFACDRLGASKMSSVTVVIAAVCTAFFASSMSLSLIGQFMLNLSMPVTLWLLYMLMPEEPGLAFGLAASALWPGTLAGMLIKLTGPAQKILIIICFVSGLFAIIYSDKERRKTA